VAVTNDFINRNNGIFGLSFSSLDSEGITQQQKQNIKKDFLHGSSPFPSD
jgi:hypothetical protein